MNALSDYELTGLTPKQIIAMYESLIATQDLISRLVCGDAETISLAVDDAVYWLDGFSSYSKEELH